jgi:hypothetical protein
MSLDRDEAARIRKIINGECSCHLSPPCTWCTELSEEEADIYGADGRNALIQHLETNL